MSSQTTEHSSDHYQVTLTREPGCVVHFKIHVTPKTTLSLRRRAMKSINKEISLPGFRKGKAPEEVILKKYGSHVEKEWKDLILQTAFNEGMKLTEVYPLNKESIKKVEISSCSVEEGSTVEVTFEAMPSIPTIAPADLVIPAVDAEPVSETKINQIIEDIRYQFADWEEVEGRPVQEGDFIDVDIENLDTPGEFICRDTRMEASPKKVGKWLLDLMIGMNVGDSKEATSEQEESLKNPDFKPTRCKVTIKAIQKSILPEVDDALAEKAGIKSAEELRDKVKKDLANMHQQEAREKQRELLKKAILDQYDFEVPESLVTERAQQLMEQRKSEIMENVGDDESVREHFKQLEQQVFKEVKDSYRWYFITHKTAQENKIEVDKNEIFTEMLQRKYMDQQSLADFKEESMEELYSYLAASILSRKVANFFIDEKAGKSS